MSIEQIKKALDLLRKKEWEACDYTSNANEAADILEQVLKQTEPEPVRLECVVCGTVYANGVPPQESPPKREPLTDEQEIQLIAELAMDKIKGAME